MAARRGPSVNVSDVPELLPGASHSATPAQRELFQRNCLQAYEAERAEWLDADVSGEAEEVNDHSSDIPATASSEQTAVELEELFPDIDKALVHSIRMETRSMQHAIETLLVLSGATAEHVSADSKQSVGVEDYAKFPCLLDASGWQVCSQRRLCTEAGADHGWLDLVQAMDTAPSQGQAPRERVRARQTVRRRQLGQEQATQEDAQETQMPTDYDLRLLAGQQRATRKGEFRVLRTAGKERGIGDDWGGQPSELEV